MQDSQSKACSCLQSLLLCFSSPFCTSCAAGKPQGLSPGSVSLVSFQQSDSQADTKV